MKYDNLREILTIEDEEKYLVAIRDRLSLPEKIFVTSILFFYIFFMIVTLAAYKNLDQKTAGRSVFYLILLVLILNLTPFVLHLLKISTFNVIHIFGIIIMVMFVAALWILFEHYDRLELDSKWYKDPHTMGIYFLLITFASLYILGTISRKL